MAQRGGRSSQGPGVTSGRSKGGAGGTSGSKAGSGKTGAARGPAGKAGSGKAGSGKGKAGSGKSKAGARQSIAAARRSKGDRTQLIIGGIAIVVIIAIIAVGIVLYQKNTAVQGSGYGVSKSSTASVDDNGIITVSNGSPSLQLDIYEDGICPYCREFETQFGQQVAKAIDHGQLIVHYHMVNFLDSHSASGNYSTRAYAALMAVAKNDGGKPGVFMKFHSALFSPDNQPKEGGSKDLSNAELASLAGSVGASKKTQKAISSGAQVEAASTDAADNLESLKAAAAKAGSSSWGTPTVLHDGTPMQTNDSDWLTNLLPKDSGSGG